MVTPEQPSPTLELVGVGLTRGAELSAKVSLGLDMIEICKSETNILQFQSSRVPNEQDLPEYELHLRQLDWDSESADEPPRMQFVASYDQNGIEGEMIFKLEAAPGNDLVGTAFALDVKSEEKNHVEIDNKMCIVKTEIAPVHGPDASYAVETFATKLPEDYKPNLTVQFWLEGQEVPPSDAWIKLEIAYFVEDADRNAEAIKAGKSGRGREYIKGSVKLFPAWNQ